MMEGRGGIGNMMNGSGMSGMQNAMNSPKGQEMIKACGNFMESYGDNAKNEPDKAGSSQN
ncbi:hypothetical protein PaeBR_08130 [Paenibacillus sp. BR2-3]|uniref:hypothetical protein n=1 Tax=Paenibacillus sp. BR2-3 TaxID=3048494 RepID=UPI00397775B8